MWFSPFTYELGQDALLALLLDCADRAEGLRQQGARVVLVTGAELSLFTHGFLPGNTAEIRLNGLLQRNPAVLAGLAELPARINKFLHRAVVALRARFAGPLTYASIHFEGVDWAPFDFVALDLYRTKETALHLRSGLHSLKAWGKPLAITEFGCATYAGATDRGAVDIMGYEGGYPVGLKGQYERDELGQAQCIAELVALFEEEGVGSAFVCTFACYYLPHLGDGQPDLDLGSFGIVKVHPGGPGEPGERRWTHKVSFAALAPSSQEGS